MRGRIITISREFGSGGRSVGKDVAQRLGVAYYDKELVKQVALETGFDEEFIEREGEYAPVKSALAYLFAGQGAHGAMNGLSAGDFLWAIQYKVIREIAEKEPCVIVGRCADYILQDRPDVLNAFIHASIPFRAERIVKLYGQADESPEERLADKDKRRRLYYKRYTNREWGMAQNYHLSLDTSVVGLERCAEIIADLARQNG